MRTGQEPRVSVGLLERTASVRVRLHGVFADACGAALPEGEYRVHRDGNGLRGVGPRTLAGERLVLSPGDEQTSRFSIETTVGREFHWQEPEVQQFAGSLTLLADAGGITAVNEIGLEGYLASVVCSEMSATSPLELIRAHAVISRSWLLAQRSARTDTGADPASGEHIRWYDREAHAGFDVCADDHCQRYHGTARILSPAPVRAVDETRGEILVHAGKACDARYGKCCGGVTEDFRVAWGDVELPYLTPVFDGEQASLPRPPLTDEQAFRRYLLDPPAAYCDCSDASILDTVLPDRDRRTTPEFFRWRRRVTSERLRELLGEKLGVDLGRPLGLEPVERGASGRLVRLRLRGEAGSLVIGKELEIRRALSGSHLLSSAFAIEAEGPPARPDAFRLTGAGWGHGVGLCQIGAAVMAHRGKAYREILEHYYPGAGIERRYR